VSKWVETELGGKLMLVIPSMLLITPPLAPITPAPEAVEVHSSAASPGHGSIRS
jgi:hypothetical protein